MVLEKEFFNDETINTIYLGGGTPSLLTHRELEILLDTIRKNYKVSFEAEITLEANPDDITDDALQSWKDTGINRLSIGVQSFSDEELKWMNRAHNSSEAKKSLQLAVSLFENITIDLIYGSPLLSDSMWKQNVDRAIETGIPHVSCYALTVEEKTPLNKMILSSKSLPVDPDKQARHFLMLMQWLQEKGYEHYEVSNFAKAGFRSRHNSSYWRGEKYLGVGPSAHSYNGNERRWNISNNNSYINGILHNQPQRESEILTSLQRLNEYIMISLRTMEGLDLKKIEVMWGKKEQDRIEQQSQVFIQRNLITDQSGFLRLTSKGMLLADGIAAELFQTTKSKK